MLLVGNAEGLTFEDSGVPYETLETEHFKVRYESGDRQAAIDVSKALEDSYEKITRDLGVRPKGKTIVELYTTPELYQRYRKPAAWAIGGNIYPGRNMIALPSPSTWGKANIHRYEDLWHVMPHEYTHVILRRYRLPMWLDEGIAVYESGQWNPGYQRILKEAVEKDALLSLKELDDFNTFITNGDLSYAESYSAVAYLKTTHGEEALKRITGGLARGLSFEKALKDATGLDKEEFEREWRLYLEDMLRPGEPEKNLLRILEDTGSGKRSRATATTAEGTSSSTHGPESPGPADYYIKEKLPAPMPLITSFAILLFLLAFLKILKKLVKRNIRTNNKHLSN
jgi:hypothetical protein